MTQSQGGAREQMGRNGGVPKRPTRTPNTARGTCTEARTVQESLWKCLWPPVSPLPPLPPPPPPDSDHLLYPYHSSSRPLGAGLNTPHFNLDTPTYTQPDKDYRYCHGMKDVDEYSFFSESSGSERESSWQFRPLGMSLLGESKQGISALQQSAYSQCERDAEEKQQHQHCFVLGADFKLERPVKVEREQEGQKPLRRFFDEWPQKSKDSWVDLEQENSHQAAAAYSKTQLSISIPMSHHDFPVTSCRYRNGLVLAA